MKKKRNIFRQETLNKLEKVMQLPMGMISNSTHFEMNSNREVIVEGCRGVLEYDENIIRVNTGKMVTCFEGRCLTIRCLNSDSLIVEGFITCIRFST